MFYRFVRFLCFIYMRIMYNVRIVGKENIPDQDKGFILISNHRDNMDPVFIATSIKPQIFFMAKAELFAKKLMGWIMNNVGAFPVERGKGDTGAIEWAGNLIQGGGILGMFPEGTRSKDGKPQRPKSGAAMIAMQTHADVLPFAVCFGEKLSFRTHVTIRIGKLIPYEALEFTPESNSPREIKLASHKMMNEIVKLLEAGI